MDGSWRCALRGVFYSKYLIGWFRNWAFVDLLATIYFDDSLGDGEPYLYFSSNFEEVERWFVGSPTWILTTRQLGAVKSKYSSL